VARAARAIARANPEDAFMAGMVHDIGQVVLALADYSRFSEIGLAAKRDCVPLHVAERQRLGVTHAEAGAYVLGTWGVPFAVVEAVAGHHEPARVKSASLDTTTAIHIAQALVSEVDASCCSVSTLDEEHLGKLGLLGEVDGWRATVARICEGARD
jgi:HD-like signal output (HDOD) protein